MNQAYTKNTNGYAVTGVAAISCRHAFVHPQGIVDLQKGKRYVYFNVVFLQADLRARYININYALASTLADDIAAGTTDVIVTYDIGCQWNKKLSQHLSKYVFMPLLEIDTLNSFRVAVPKFHIIGHGASCQATYNLAYMDGAGMTHGEGVETIWSHSGLLATWSRENGPGARHLILDDHWSGWNWRKYIGLRESSTPGRVWPN